MNAKKIHEKRPWLFAEFHWSRFDVIRILFVIALYVSFELVAILTSWIPKPAFLYEEEASGTIKSFDDLVLPSLFPADIAKDRDALIIGLNVATISVCVLLTLVYGFFAVLFLYVPVANCPTRQIEMKRCSEGLAIRRFLALFVVFCWPWAVLSDLLSRGIVSWTFPLAGYRFLALDFWTYFPGLVHGVIMLPSAIYDLFKKE